MLREAKLKLGFITTDSLLGIFQELIRIEDFIKRLQNGTETDKEILYTLKHVL
jgi:hypothetical protein